MGNMNGPAARQLFEGTNSVNDAEGWVSVRILRQDHPAEASYWQSFLIRREPGLNVTGVLQRIATEPKTTSGEIVAPIAYEANCLEEVCGSCTMLVNGRTRQACSALVERLVADQPGEIELRPLSKFPVVRDLVVDRRRLFRALEKVEAWIPVDGYYDQGPGPRQSQQEQQQAYPLSECMSCGCCLEACPQNNLVQIQQSEGEPEAEFKAKQDAHFDRTFIGAHAMNQVVLINSHPTGRFNAGERLDAATAEGGIQQCGNAQNCTAVCPKRIPLTDSWGRIGRAATLHAIKKFFG
ncbi:Fumarate reductase iron-sulfur subunit [Anatilimnocola aggregata]|uniref:succinate dehydrogenase n=2 Tax=Anatilimnocola aggregata TaxID=2528021 RepID=A0A517YFP3_9BACT|nr:Fumarate reductase iron-sulfur subunit [Anatilimnocola aggregata]